MLQNVSIRLLVLVYLRQMVLLSSIDTKKNLYTIHEFLTGLHKTSHLSRALVEADASLLEYYITREYI